MKVHNDLKELLEDFVMYQQDYESLSELKNYQIQLITDFVSSNSLALGKPEPLAKNKQTENRCRRCNAHRDSEKYITCMLEQCDIPYFDSIPM